MNHESNSRHENSVRRRTKVIGASVFFFPCLLFLSDYSLDYFHFSFAFFSTPQIIPNIFVASRKRKISTEFSSILFPPGEEGKTSPGRNFGEKNPDSYLTCWFVRSGDKMNSGNYLLVKFAAKTTLFF